MKTELVVIFISTLILAILIALISLFYIPKKLMFYVWCILIIILNYVLIVNPSKILLLGLLQVRAPSDFRNCLEKYHTKYSDQERPSDYSLHVIEDPGYCAAYFVDYRMTHFVFSSHLVEDWNEIDIESTILYLLELKREASPLRDTSILVLATIAERFIITSFIGAALVHLFRSLAQDSKLDERAVSKMKYAMGYENMLTKLKQGSQLQSRIPASFGMNGIGDIAKKSVNQPLYAVHESIEARIESSRVLNA
jgi:hypothetical protein